MTPTPRRRQAALSIALLGAVSLTALGTDLVAHSRSLEDHCTAWELRRFDAGVERYMDRGGFIDSEDRLLLQQLPEADYARGGVYFFGTSAMKWGTMLWDLPPERQKYVHNYGIGATDHEMQLELIRFLVEDRGLLRAGGQKSLLVVSLYWPMGIHCERTFFESLWGRHGVYRFRPGRGIESKPMPALVRKLLIEKSRCSSFLAVSANRIGRYVAERLGIAVCEPLGVVSADAVERYFAYWNLTENWQTSLDEQMNALQALWDYVQAHDARCVFVLLPVRSAIRPMPHEIAYRQRVQAFCERESAQLLDLTGLLGDDGFWDINHTSPAGLKKLHEALMKLIEPHLREIGAW